MEHPPLLDPKGYLAMGDLKEAFLSLVFKAVRDPLGQPSIPKQRGLLS
jgi:hypothetical protein